jgi:hypothetical protein
MAQKVKGENIKRYFDGDRGCIKANITTRGFFLEPKAS